MSHDKNSVAVNNRYLDLITLVNDNLVDNSYYLMENLAFVYYGSIVNQL